MSSPVREFEGLLRSLPRERSFLLPGLHRLQHEQGYVSPEGMRALADRIRVPAVEVHAAAGTYNELRFAPPPPGLRRVCTGLACRLNGADALLRQERESGAPVEEVACFFNCGVAPVVEAGAPPAMAGHAGVGSSAPSSDALHPQAISANGTTRRAALLVGGGSCGRALGAGAVLAALRDQARDTALDVIETGCDGACWAQPSVRLRLANGTTTLLALNATAADASPLVATGGALAGGMVAATAAHAQWLRGQERRVLARCGAIDPESLAEYRAAGGYTAWERVRRVLSPQAVVQLVAESGLLGRGGAYFPAARKWETAIRAPGEVYLLVNLEEGEPGVYKDRHLCEGDPHAVLEGTLIAAHALRAARIYLYVNGQAELATRRLELAIARAHEAGLLPEGVPIEIRRGAGGYVCGEESVLLNSIEGQRAVPRLRPPFPAEAGLWGRPTVINNAETLASLPLIVRHGSAWFRGVGSEQAPGTKLLCLSGAVPRPGLVEVPFGTPLRQIVEDVAGAERGRTVALVTGGPSGGLIPEGLLDLPLRPGTLDEGGAILGAGGMTVVDETLTPLEVVRQLTAYNAAESCGKCTPCREGTQRTEALLAQAAGRELDATELAQLDALNETIRLASLCGLGQAAPNPVTSLIRHWPLARGGT
ncbi:MAG TPA: NADH-ubiquinone oxidoreductase-F iron-sulfur binding region domain-containing protein [Dehalococcoidia bacterium]|nr:NADH-ubiquinone oxidoreductase-F iron-sulfur binding region domain-containing protein [Dehalococcoidia bacterium]